MTEQTILITDDNEALRSFLIGWLGLCFHGVRILDAADGETGVLLAVSEHPDVVLMDIEMPGIGGLEATRQIKTQTPDVPVIVMTGNCATKDRVDAKRAGANGFVFKPKINIDLLPMLTTLLQKAPPESTAL
jgi:two-component system cell cycle response regulator DivK